MGFLVYQHVIKDENGNIKRYIGCTSQSPERRWKNGTCSYKGRFLEAIKQYGWDNFEHKVIVDGLTEEEALSIEALLIDYFKAYDPEHGYNVCRYSNICQMTTGRCQSEETKHKISETIKSKRLPI